MKTILIPVDFTETSNNAIQYAANLSCDARVERIILLKSYYTSVYAELLPSPDLVQLSEDDIAQERQKFLALLKTLSTHISNNCPAHIKVETVISNLPLLRAIHQTIANEQADVLIVGSDGNSAETYIGDHIISIAKTSTIPVLIVPANVKYKHIKTALVPCDLDAISSLDVLRSLRTSQNWPQPELMILSVDPNHKHTASKAKNAEAIAQVLEGYTHHIHYTRHHNTVQGILTFADTHHAQLIIALPGKHSFFYNLTHKSITEALSHNAKKPVLILK
jgi:nucleotide-binding universal stress UspA family protein